MHTQVLRVDVGDRQLHDGEQLGGRRIGFGPLLVGGDAHGVDREAVVGAVRQLGVDVLLLARQGGERYLQPDHVAARHHHIADPVRRPGVIQHRFTLFVAGDGVGDHRRVVALVVLDGVAQAVGLDVVVDHRFAAPARGAAGQIGLAVAVGVEQLGDLGILKLLDVGDVILLGGLLVDQVALRGAVDVDAFAVELGVAACGLVLIGVQRIPVDRDKGRVAGGDRGVGDVVIHFTRFFHVVTQFFQRLADQQRLEGLFGNGALHRLYRDPLAG
ncbi:Uncharacterised protein [Serratia marcescens]|nr:Uncharacterised protein [Serratia marcescens]